MQLKTVLSHHVREDSDTRVIGYRRWPIEEESLAVRQVSTDDIRTDAIHIAKVTRKKNLKGSKGICAI